MKTEADLERAVIATMREILPAEFRKAAITPEMRLQRDLGLDSLGIASLLFRLEEEFGLDLFSDPELSAKMGDLRSVADLAALAFSLRRQSRS
ncbi:MAG TPA: acyl carrier protein [Alphaproteobacteria bacterium]|nr:acyl carrier protein [Alphaproteobacteria bacterium]